MSKKLYNIYSKDQLIANAKLKADDYITISFYKYYKILNPVWFRDFFYLALDEIEVLGRVYLAYEGINAQIAVPKNKLEAFNNFINSISFLEKIRLNFAIEEHEKSFYKLKVKIRNKIVADGIEDPSFDSSNSGIHLDARSFNDLISLPDTILVDMRNHYESEVGHFENAILPEVSTFRESLPIIVEQLKESKERPLVMYCTGGIRCEKASAYMKHHGFQNVYQLNGGIIHYAKEVQEQGLENKFLGKNFVFDDRLGEKISDDIISICHQCGSKCDTHVNCLNDQCHILFIQCTACAEKYQHCCSRKCAEFNQLDQTQKSLLRTQYEFNGSKFSKGRYKAHTKDEPLDLH